MRKNLILRNYFTRGEHLKTNIEKNTYNQEHLMEKTEVLGRT